MTVGGGARLHGLALDRGRPEGRGLPRLSAPLRMGPVPHPPHHIVFGPGIVDRLGGLVAELGVERAFVVTDPGIVAAGHWARAEEALRAADIEVRRFDAVRENPTSLDVDRCVEALGSWDASCLIGLGGGSSIDVAKGCAFLQAGGGSMADYRGNGKARGNLLPIVAVPTTAGTGTEMQSFALIGEEETHRKMACGDAQALPALAVLDPSLTVTQPRFVTACTGFDALGHAVETAVTRERNATSAHFSSLAFKILVEHLPRVLDDPGDVEARGQMMIGAAWAGYAIEHSMLGAAHSMANPLTAQFGVVHGQAVGMSLLPVVRYNASDPEASRLYAELARGAALAASESTDAEAVAALVARLEELLGVAGFGLSLAAHGVPPSAAEVLAPEAAEQWTAQFNPRAVSAEGFVELFREACSGGDGVDP